MAAKRLANTRLESGSKEVNEPQEVLREEAIAEDKARLEVFGLLDAELRSTYSQISANEKISTTFDKYPNLRSDKVFMLNVVEGNPKLFKEASPKLRNDVDIAREAIERDPDQFEFVSDKLKNDRELVLLAVSKDGSAMRYVDDRFWADREIAKAALSAPRFPTSLEPFSDEIKSDREIILAMAMAKAGSSIRYAASELRGDKEVVLAAVSRYAYELEFASEELRHDPEVVLAAIKRGGSSVWWGSVIREPEILGNMEIAKALVERGGSLYISDFSDDVKGNRDFALFAMRVGLRDDNNGVSLLDFPQLRGDKEVVLLAVRQEWYNFRNASEELRDDEEVFLAAMQYSKSAINFASERLQKKFRVRLFGKTLDVDAEVHKRALEENEKRDSEIK